MGKGTSFIKKHCTKVKLDLLFSQCSFEANGHFTSNPFIFCVFFLMPCLLRGWRALSIPGQYSFSCPEQAGRGKEHSIYKAIENTLTEWFCTFHGCRQIKELCLNLFFCMRSQERYLYFWPQWKSIFADNRGLTGISAFTFM